MFKLIKLVGRLEDDLDDVIEGEYPSFSAAIAAATAAVIAAEWTNGEAPMFLVEKDGGGPVSFYCLKHDDGSIEEQVIANEPDSKSV